MLRLIYLGFIFILYKTAGFIIMGTVFTIHAQDGETQVSKIWIVMDLN